MRLKPTVWYLNAAHRTLLAAVPALARPDDAWASAYLTSREFALFVSLPAQERAHGVEVARRLLRRSPRATSELIAAALLHDVGKLGTPQGALWRVLTHLLPHAGAARSAPRLRGLAGARQARAHHATYGAELLRDAGSSARVVALVEGHHSAAGDPDLRLLQECDERT